MSKLNPLIFITGLLACCMGLLMMLCGIIVSGQDVLNSTPLSKSGFAVFSVALFVAMSTFRSDVTSITRSQAFLLTVLVWVVLPMFGAVPFVLGPQHAGITDSYFEAVSGMTTTGSTVFHNLENLSPEILLWRGVLQWLGGLGIVIVAMIFLPIMRVGGMQFFLTEGFDTQGKLLPRSLDIAKALLTIYVLLTVVCATVYACMGMSGFDAVVHAMTTISTGGFSNSDQSFARFEGSLEYASAFFMVAASLPLIRFVQLARGNGRPLAADPQIRAYLATISLLVCALTMFRTFNSGEPVSEVFRESLFNVVSIISGTGYASEDVAGWGSFALFLLLLAGLIGGCTGSTACSIKIFRWQVVFAGIASRVRQVRHPSIVTIPTYGGKKLSTNVIESAGTFMTFFAATVWVVAIGLSLTGLTMKTSMTAAWTAVANVGPAFGPEVQSAGSLEFFNAPAKWIMIFGMIAGRLELLTPYVLFTRRYWSNG